jgi:hypothetical protein
MAHSSEPRFENLLAALTDAILADESELDDIFERHSISRPEVEDLVQLIQRLKAALVIVRPQKRYIVRLKQDLVGQPERNVIERWRYLPPRVQIAAMIALAAGFVFLSRRRISAHTGDVKEVPALQNS